MTSVFRLSKEAGLGFQIVDDDRSGAPCLVHWISNRNSIPDICTYCTYCALHGVQLGWSSASQVCWTRSRCAYFVFFICCCCPPFEVYGVKRLSSQVYPPGLRIWNTRSRMTSEDLNASEPRKHDGGNRRIDANLRELGRESNPCNPLAQDPFGGK